MPAAVSMTLGDPWRSRALDEGGHVEGSNVEWLAFARVSHGGDQQRLVAGRPRWKPFRMIGIPIATRYLHRRFRTIGILDENGIGQTVDVIADPVRFKGEPVAVRRPPTGARLEFL